MPNFYENLEFVLQYHTYLDDEIINEIIKVKNSKFIDVFVGKEIPLCFIYGHLKIISDIMKICR